jgi:hypothetical protein
MLFSSEWRKRHVSSSVDWIIEEVDVKAWYFGTEDRRLAHGDGRRIVTGRTHKIKGTPILCEHGLHGSNRLIDALKYSAGPIIWRVDMGGTMVHGNDKMVATERTYLWGIDGSTLLRVFARRCALDVVHLWAAPEVVVQYLKTGDESIRDAAEAAAEAAARAAARAAAEAAARAAARAAAEAAARAAAWAAAEAAARAAARAAAWVAARDAALAAQNRRLTQMVMAEHRRLM